MSKFSLRIFILAFCLFYVESTYAQPTCASWQQRSITNAPTARLRHTLAYHAAISKGVLFGGTTVTNSSLVLLDDTWLWNSAAGNWEGPIAGNHPAARYGAASAFDPNRGVVVLFGGSDINNVPFGDVWEFNGTSWTDVTPAGGASPSPRVFHNLAFNDLMGQVMLVGGLTNGTFQQDTWAWSGTAWTKITDFQPTARGFSALSFDSSSLRAFLFGGFDGVNFFNDIWQLDFTTWTKLSPVGNPAERIESTFTYLPTLKRSILFGGSLISGVSAGDTWGWTGSGWEQFQIPGPSARRGAAAVYDPTQASILLFGGTNESGQIVSDTWSFITPDSDKDGIADCLDSCPTDATNSCAVVGISSVKPKKPSLKMNGKMVQVSMEKRANVRYIIKYFDKQKLPKGRKPKIITINAKSTPAKVRNLIEGRTYSFSYQYQEKTGAKAFSQASPGKAIKVKFPRGRI